ncbi:MAG: T9SS type A sorting domain-containing protein [Candidatus Stahlbacteria bacterium]|nr:T9SS type A sorting domain-containing protein [Candidatus Stahlbacteria bacterium]
MIGPGGGGHFIDVTADPHNLNTVFATVNVSGVRKSTDRGESWNDLSNGLDFATYGYNAHQGESFAIHPKIPDLLFFGSRSHQIYRRTSSSPDAQWQAVHTLYPYPWQPPYDDELGYNIGCFAFHPIFNYKIYAGQGGPPTIFNDGWVKKDMDGKIYFSNDTGSIWSEAIDMDIVLNHPDVNIFSIQIKPLSLNSVDSNEVFISTNYGIYKLSEMGANWTLLDTLNQGLPADIGYGHWGGRMIADPKYPNEIYLSIICNTDSISNWATWQNEWQGGIYKTTNWGILWFPIGRNSITLEKTGNPSNPREITNFFDLKLDTNGLGTLYTANMLKKNNNTTTGIYKYTDIRTINETNYSTSTINWENITNKNCVEFGWKEDDSNGVFEPYALSLSPLDTTLIYFIADAGQIFRLDSVSGNGINYWKQISTKMISPTFPKTFITTGLEGIAFTLSTAIDPANPNTFYLGFGDHAWFKSTDGGNSLYQINYLQSYDSVTTLGDAAEIIVDKDYPNLIYAASRGKNMASNYGNIYLSKNFGENGSWNLIGGSNSKNNHGQNFKVNGYPIGGIWSFFVDYDSPVQRTLYVARYENNDLINDTTGIYKATLDTAGNFISLWRPIWEKSSIRSMVKKGNYIFAGRDINGKIFQINLTNGSATQVNTTNIGTTIYQIKKNNGDSLFAATDNGFWINNGDGINWTLLYNTQMTNPIAINGDIWDFVINNNIITLVSPYVGVIRSTNGGISWQDVTGNMSSKAAMAIDADPSNPEKLFVNTRGAGVWIRDFLATVTESPITVPVTNIKVYPNPFTFFTLLKYSVPKPANVSLKIYNLAGQMVKTLVNKNQKTGNYTVKWNGTDDTGHTLGSGIYFYKLEIGDKFSQIKLIHLSTICRVTTALHFVCGSGNSIQ